MKRYKTLPSICAKLLLVSSLSMVIPAYAEGDPPPPVTVTTVLAQEVGLEWSKDQVMGPNSSYQGPNGNAVTITNRYYPMFNNTVKTDGKADTTFDIPWPYNIDCSSDVRNDAGQYSTPKTSAGDSFSCPWTAQSSISSAVHGTTYRPRTQSWWRWSDYAQGYGLSEQSHYEP